MEVHIIKTNDIYLNLALEQVLFLELPAGTRRLLIWKDAPCIVMGRFQNPWVECDLEGTVFFLLEGKVAEVLFIMIRGT